MCKERNEYDFDIHSSKAALHIAIENECLDIVELLLSVKNIDVNLIASYSDKQLDGNNSILVKRTKTPLYIAMEKNNIEIVKLLLKQKEIKIGLILTSSIQDGRPVNQKKETAIDLAIQKGNQEIIDLLKKT